MQIHFDDYTNSVGLSFIKGNLMRVLLRGIGWLLVLGLLFLAVVIYTCHFYIHVPLGVMDIHLERGISNPTSNFMVQWVGVNWGPTAATTSSP